MPASSRKIPHTYIPTPLDPKAIRHYLRTLIRSQNHLHQRETPRHTHTVITDIWQFVAFANTQVHADEHAQALMTLQAVTDVFTDQWMYLNDIHGEVSTFFQELARVWTETLLRVDLTAKERTRWAKQLTIWQTRLADVSRGTTFDAPQAAIQEGWDSSLLQRILQGGAPQQRVWEGEIPTYAPQLIQARLTVLEQRGLFQEYLHLAKAEGDTRAYVTMLLRQGQITEAITYGHQHLATTEDAFAVAQALLTHGERSSSLQMAAHGLTLEGNPVPLAIWLRDQAWAMGEQMQALEAGEIAFRNDPTLKQYLRIADIAGTDWPEHRAKLLNDARQASFTADPQDVLRIFLHEHLFDDAIAVLKTHTNYTLVAQVVDAALKEQTALEWVTKACRQQAEHIMNGAKASYYQAATTLLTKARTADHMLGRDEAWHIYLHDLLDRHQHKSKLLPLLMALAEKEDITGEK